MLRALIHAHSLRSSYSHWTKKTDSGSNQINGALKVPRPGNKATSTDSIIRHSIQAHWSPDTPNCSDMLIWPSLPINTGLPLGVGWVCAWWVWVCSVLYIHIFVTKISIFHMTKTSNGKSSLINYSGHWPKTSSVINSIRLHASIKLILWAFEFSHTHSLSLSGFIHACIPCVSFIHTCHIPPAPHWICGWEVCCLIGY